MKGEAGGGRRRRSVAARYVCRRCTNENWDSCQGGGGEDSRLEAGEQGVDARD